MAMHACQIGPTDTAPPCPGSPQRTCNVTRGKIIIIIIIIIIIQLGQDATTFQKKW